MKVLRILALFVLVPFCIGQTTSTKPAETKQTEKQKSEKKDHGDHKAGMDCCKKDADGKMACKEKKGDAAHGEHAGLDCCKKDADGKMACSHKKDEANSSTEKRSCCADGAECCKDGAGCCKKEAKAKS